MKVEYAIVGLVISLAYAAVKKWLPDFPVSEEVFQMILFYILVKIGVEVSNKPADALRAKFVK